MAKKPAVQADNDAPAIRVNADLFRLAYMAVSTEETRYYLNGVNIEPHPEKGALLVSTDGRRMVVAHDPEGICREPAIVKLPRFALALCRTPKMFDDKRLLEVDGNCATIIEQKPGASPLDPPKREALATAHHVVIDGKFVDWRRVVPREEQKSAASTAFNPRYLKEWGALGHEVEKLTGKSGVQIGLSDGNCPTIIRFGADNIFGVLMPMRFGVTHGLLPSFMSETPAQSVAAE